VPANGGSNEIVECPALLPGTLGVIEIKAAGIRGEFLWPSIRPTARPRRRNLSVVKSTTARTTSARSSDGASISLSAIGARAALPASIAQSALQTKADADDQQTVPVTALDHAAPATASNAEAIGGNVVQFNTAREALGAGVERPAMPPSEDGREGVARLLPGMPDRWPLLGKRSTAMIATAAVLLSGGYLLLGRSPTINGYASLPRPASVPTPKDVQEDQRAAALAAQRPVQRTEPSASVVASPHEASMPVHAAEDVRPAGSEALPQPTLQTAPQAAKPSPQVTLRMRGGGFQISGELKGFDGTKYVIETRAAGVLTMDAARFECEGEACARPLAAILPLSERPSPSKPDLLRIEGAPALTAEFVPQLIRDYAASIGASASELPRDVGAPADQSRRYRLADPRGVELATIDIVPSGSLAGLNALERGTAAMALVDRPLMSGSETRERSVPRGRAGAKSNAPPSQPPASVTEVLIGLDGIAVVASPSTAPGSIPLELLAKVVAGQITDWFELGQSPGPIALYLPPDGTGTMETFVRQVMRPRGLDVTRSARRPATEVDAADAAARDPRGLALVSFAAIRGAKPVSLETACGLVVRPTAFAVKAGEYPLVRRLSLHLPPQLSQPSARGIVRIAQSVDIASAVAAARILDSSIASLPIEEQSERMAWAANAPAAAFDAAELRQMLTDLQGATRLSVTFRFVAGTNELDQAARRDIARLVLALKEPGLAGRRIMLAGFTDASGKLPANMTAATRRAGQVRAALVAAAGSGVDQRLLTSKGYGPLAPVACAGTPDGTHLNRRVEVWVGGREVRSFGR
jgi:phosphate transport system substrate-binding protein